MDLETFIQFDVFFYRATSWIRTRILKAIVSGPQVLEQHDCSSGSVTGVCISTFADICVLTYPEMHEVEMWDKKYNDSSKKSVDLAPMEMHFP